MHTVLSCRYHYFPATYLTCSLSAAARDMEEYPERRAFALAAVRPVIPMLQSIIPQMSFLYESPWLLALGFRIAFLLDELEVVAAGPPAHDELYTLQVTLDTCLNYLLALDAACNDDDQVAAAEKARQFFRKNPVVYRTCFCPPCEETLSDVNPHQFHTHWRLGHSTSIDIFLRTLFPMPENVSQRKYAEAVLDNDVLRDRVLWAMRTVLLGNIRGIWHPPDPTELKDRLTLLHPTFANGQLIGMIEADATDSLSFILRTLVLYYTHCRDTVVMEALAGMQFDEYMSVVYTVVAQELIPCFRERTLMLPAMIKPYFDNSPVSQRPLYVYTPRAFENNLRLSVQSEARSIQSQALATMTDEQSRSFGYRLRALKQLPGRALKMIALRMIGLTPDECYLVKQACRDFERTHQTDIVHVLVKSLSPASVLCLSEYLRSYRSAPPVTVSRLPPDYHLAQVAAYGDGDVHPPPVAICLPCCLLLTFCAESAKGPQKSEVVMPDLPTGQYLCYVCMEPVVFLDMTGLMVGAKGSTYVYCCNCTALTRYGFYANHDGMSICRQCYKKQVIKDRHDQEQEGIDWEECYFHEGDDITQRLVDRSKATQLTIPDEETGEAMNVWVCHRHYTQHMNKFRTKHVTMNDWLYARHAARKHYKRARTDTDRHTAH